MSQLSKILLVDDDDDLREALAEQITLATEFLTETAATATEGVAKAQNPDISLILLDIDLPDLDGREACRLMRQKGVKCPVVMLTGKNTDADTILGLDAGANDYVSKPFKLSVLLARIRAQIRQHQSSDDATFKVGPYAFTPATKMMADEAGRKIRLTEKETGILKYLLRSNAKIVSRDNLLGEVWGYSAQVTTHTLETHIYRLRQKIEPDPSNPCLLLTEVGGYRLS